MDETVGSSPTTMLRRGLRNESRLTLSLSTEESGSEKTTSFSDALVITGFPYERDNIEDAMRRFARVLKECRDVRRFGASSMDICLVASGRADAYFEMVNLWDMAAATLIETRPRVIFDFPPKIGPTPRIWFGGNGTH